MCQISIFGSKITANEKKICQLNGTNLDITIKILSKIPVAVIHTRYDLLKKGSGFTFSALPMLNCIIKKKRDFNTTINTKVYKTKVRAD